MQIKSIVTELCEVKSKDRVEYIVNFLRNNNIEHNVQKFPGGINIEVVKYGECLDKEMLFFAHHDVFNELIEGANDNTSSVAVLLATAKYLYFYRPYYTLRIVFNDSEELLGGVSYFKGFNNNFNEILNKVGSYYYLKNLSSIPKVKAVFVLELSGIGDSIYAAQRSGDIICDNDLINFLELVAKNNNFEFINMPISFSDMISVDYFNLKGTVLGSIPLIEGKNYLNDIKENGLSRDVYPHVWKKNHTPMDNYFSIQDKSLQMTYNYLIEVIKNINKLSD